MLENLREVSSLNEVLSVLNTCSKEKLKFILWQTIDESRVQTECSIVFYTDKSPCNIVVEVDEFVDFNKSDEIFLYQDELQFLFKGKINTLKDKRVSITSFGELYLEEKREKLRLQFENISFNLKFNYLDRNAVKRSFEADLLDISETGLCFSIAAQRGSTVFENMNVSLYGIENTDFNEEIKGRVVYITPYQTRFSQTNLRVGVKFDSVDKNISIVLQLLRNKKKFFSS